MILTVLALLGMQQGVADRLSGRVPPDVGAVVESLATSAAARGLPLGPLIQKAIEGSAKGIASERVIAAVGLVAMQLDTAAAALRAGGIISDTLAIAAGAFAINAGMDARDITNLILRGGGQTAVNVRLELNVAGTLVAMGVPSAEAANLVSASLQSGRPATDLLLLPSRVQGEMARGATPAQAAAGLARAAAAQARRGPPPAHPQPPPHPPSPPHP
ncbi:MAG TPA: hypothetical protein VEK77_09890 [Gemmatimonadales bacterium]|nr:hypothetical protein [Gemmatimonadales bacterium]